MSAAAVQSPSPPRQCIGVFDSGVGGLSVLVALRRAVPQADLLYVADSAHAPYGERSAAAVIDRSQRLSHYLRQQGAGLIVVACNTATALAIQTLRTADPETPYVGVEPGVRPALAASRTARVGVLATPATVASDRIQALVARERGTALVELVACAGLAAAIERGHAADAEIDALLDLYTAPLRAARVDVVALGCTHYPFVATRIAARLGPDVLLVDTAEAVARRVAQCWGGLAAQTGGQTTAAQTLGVVRLESTGDPGTLNRLAREGCGLSATGLRITV